MDSNGVTNVGPPGSYVTNSKLKAFFNSVVRGHAIVSKLKTPFVGPFGMLLYRSRYVMSPKNGQAGGRRAA